MSGARSEAKATTSSFWNQWHGPDAGRVARDERVAVADEAAEDVAAVPVLGGPGQDPREVEVLADPRESSAPARSRVLR
jgi:hypothetical protein